MDKKITTLCRNVKSHKNYSKKFKIKSWKLYSRVKDEWTFIKQFFKGLSEWIFWGNSNRRTTKVLRKVETINVKLITQNLIRENLTRINTVKLKELKYRADLKPFTNMSCINLFEGPEEREEKTHVSINNINTYLHHGV